MLIGIDLVATAHHALFYVHIIIQSLRVVWVCTRRKLYTHPPPGKTSLTQPNHHVVTNTLQEVEQLGKDLVGEEGEAHAFKREFDRLDKGNGVVEMRDMPRVIEGALGREVRPWIKDRILKMFENNKDGKVSWLELQDGLRMVSESFKADVSLKGRTVPAWLASERKVAKIKGFFYNEFWWRQRGSAINAWIHRARCQEVAS